MIDVPFKDFSVGEILTSSDVDTYLMSQVIIRCTSSTRPSSPAQGWHIYETDTRCVMQYTGASWVFLAAAAQYAYKTADESVSNSTTLQDDNHLSLPVVANANYWIDFILLYTSASDTGDFFPSLSVPPGATFVCSIQGMDQAATSSIGSIFHGELGVGGALLGATNANLVLHIRGFLRVGATAGTAKLQWAQATASASATTVKAGSAMVLTRLS